MMINPFNFMPNPNSTAPVWQQYQEYEAQKLFGETVSIVIILTLLVAVLVTLLIVWFSRREADKTIKEISVSKGESNGKI